MDTRPTVLVTRPEGQGLTLCGALEAEGFGAFSLPMMELVVLPPDEHNHQIVTRLDGFEHVIFISGNAVQFGLPCLRAQWATLPTHPRWYAIGEATAAKLAESGVSAICAGAAMTTESLLALSELALVGGEKVLIVKGVGGRQSLREGLEARGALVEELQCYARKSPRMPAGELVKRLTQWQIDIILISSGEGLDNMLTLLSPEESSKLKVMPLVVPSRRVAEQALRAGFGSVKVAANATDQAMLAALQEWWQEKSPRSGSGV